MRPCKKYTKAFISRFKDNEVSDQEGNAFARHLKACKHCATTLADYENIDRSFTSHTRGQAEAILKLKAPITLGKSPREKGALFSDLMGRKRAFGLYFKLASLVCAVLILVVSLAPWQSDLQPEPSAIVNSIDTYGSSVMIIDTIDTQHTIIWFSET